VEQEVQVLRFLSQFLAGRASGSSARVWNPLAFVECRAPKDSALAGTLRDDSVVTPALLEWLPPDAIFTLP